MSPALKYTVNFRGNNGSDAAGGVDHQVEQTAPQLLTILGELEPTSSKLVCFQDTSLIRRLFITVDVNGIRKAHMDLE